MATDTLSCLLDCLADRQLHSGESLGAALGVSRAAVWKQVRLARALGVPLQAIKGEGYRLQPGFELLDADAIEQACQPATHAHCPDISVLRVTDSTNSEVMRRFGMQAEGGFAILAEKQTAGRGRRGRAWYSPFGASLYLSIGWVSHEGVAAFEGLSLVAGLKVIKALERFGIRDLMLKWPNDVYWHHRKLAGILVDVQGDPSGTCQLAVGIGINISLPTTASVSIDQPWVDASSILSSSGDQGRGLSRNRLAAAVLDEIMPVFDELAHDGFSTYRDEWQHYDLCKSQRLCLQYGSSIIEGKGCGINAQGAYGMMLDSSTGESIIQYFSGGEITLRIKHADSSELVC